MESAGADTQPAEPTNATNNGTAQLNGKHDEAHYKLPEAKMLREAGELKIKDENGNEIPFKSLYENQPGQQLVSKWASPTSELRTSMAPLHPPFLTLQ